MSPCPTLTVIMSSMFHWSRSACIASLWVCEGGGRGREGGVGTKGGGGSERVHPR